MCCSYKKKLNKCECDIHRMCSKCGYCYLHEHKLTYRDQQIQWYFTCKYGKKKTFLTFMDI